MVNNVTYILPTIKIFSKRKLTIDFENLIHTRQNEENKDSKDQFSVLKDVKEI